MKVVVIIIGLILYTVNVQGQCWWSGFQPKSWAKRRCFPSTDWQQISSQSRDNGNGDMYNCCPSGSQGPPGQNVEASESGLCSWYGADGEIPSGYVLPSGEIFDRFAMKAAHKTLSFGTRIRVTNKNNGRSVDVTINDRGPFVAGRIVDLTYGAFGQIENRDAGVIPCSYVTI